MAIRFKNQIEEREWVHIPGVEVSVDTDVAEMEEEEEVSCRGSIPAYADCAIKAIEDIKLNFIYIVVRQKAKIRMKE